MSFSNTSVPFYVRIFLCFIVFFRNIQSANSGKIPASFGLEYQRQSGSSVQSEATITEAVDDVICEDESHREVILTLESPAFRRGEGSTGVNSSGEEVYGLKTQELCLTTG